MEALKPTEERLQLHDLTTEASKPTKWRSTTVKKSRKRTKPAERLAHDIEAEEKEREKAKEHLESSTRKMESAEQDLSDRTPRIKPRQSHHRRVVDQSKQSEGAAEVCCRRIAASDRRQRSH